MASARFRLIPPLFCLLLVVQTLRPAPLIERVIDVAVTPARLIAEVAAPLQWIEADTVQASTAARAAFGQRRVERLVELDLALRASANPSTVLIGGATRGVHAEVIGREARQRDRIRLRVDNTLGIVPGLPVVYGDSFVGVISGVPQASTAGGPTPFAGHVICDLITGKNSRIVARLIPRDGGPESRLVVGGLVSGGSDVRLNIHSPTWVDPAPGLVLVDEPEEFDEGHTRLANGFFLGDLDQYLKKSKLDLKPGEVQDLSYSVRPRLDYSSGLHQVLILAPGTSTQDQGPTSVDPMETGEWALTRFLMDGGPSPARSGARIPLGSVAGIHPGTALAVGRDLVGRVARVGPFSGTVRSLADPGMRLTAVALIHTPDGERAHVLGKLMALGRRKDGLLLYEWPATVPIVLDNAAQEESAGRLSHTRDGGSPRLGAELWTGSGEPGVPLGLYIGETTLPTGIGPHVIAIRPSSEARGLGKLRVRLPDRAVLEGLEGGGD